MQNITVGRYEETPVVEGVESPKGHDYAGWIEPEDRSWIMYVRDDHSVEMFLHRDPDTGAVLEETAAV